MLHISSGSYLEPDSQPGTMRESTHVQADVTVGVADRAANAAANGREGSRLPDGT